MNENEMNREQSSGVNPEKFENDLIERINERKRQQIDEDFKAFIEEILKENKNNVRERDNSDNSIDDYITRLDFSNLTSDQRCQIRDILVDFYHSTYPVHKETVSEEQDEKPIVGYPSESVSQDIQWMSPEVTRRINDKIEENSHNEGEQKGPHL